MLNAMEWTSTWPRKSVKITTGATHLLDYAQQIGNRLTRAQARTVSSDGTSSAVVDIDNQVIDITATFGLLLDQADLVGQVYVFRDPVNVHAFLDCYPFLVPLLLEAAPHLEHYFPGQNIFLEVVNDPESTDTSQLVAIVVETTSPEEAFDRLEQFDQAWWVGAVRRAKGKLCIDVAFA
jgi:hypothetical protein